MNVALIYGGRSAEHEVSIMSAKTIERLLIEGNHTVLLIAIDRRGRWFLQEHLTDEIDQSTPLYIIPADGIYTHRTKLAIDVAFPT
ncbi:MAG: D-alanine--D-alanine ligase, partial [Sphaerochaeta sp.]